MRTLVAFMALLLAVVPARAAVAKRDWSLVATRKADGAFVQGNPAAPVKLVEYLSFTCPHCAAMEGQAIAPLTARYIKPGLVSYEVRHALRDAFDFSASLLARCAGPRAFFAAAPAVYADQRTWLTRGATWSQTAPPDLPPDKLLPAVAQAAGLDTFFSARGLTADKAGACLRDPAERKLLGEMANEAWNRPGFPGTPAFLLDGAPLDHIGSWADLDRELTAALKK